MTRQVQWQKRRDRKAPKFFRGHVEKGGWSCKRPDPTSSNNYNPVTTSVKVPEEQAAATR